jgi:prevent-host-death family protein
MEYVSVTEAKNRLSSLLARVAAGEDVIITDRGRPVARLEPIGRGYPDPEGRAERLQRAGVLVPPKGGSLDEVLGSPPVAAGGARVLDALLEERAEGR